MSISCIYEKHRYVITFDDKDEALRFVMDWRFGKGGGGDGYNLGSYKKWGLPQPDSAFDHVEVDAAIIAGLKKLMIESPKK